MRFYYSYITISKQIIESYKGEMPFSAYLKQFFATQKKIGSKDRKVISSLCFNYFRIINGLQNADTEKGLMTALFLFSNQPNGILEQFNQSWNNNIELSVKEKAQLAGVNIYDLFPLNEALSPQIESLPFNESHLIQPLLFIRTRPGKHQKVFQKLKESDLSFEVIGNNCIALSNGTKLDEIIKINDEAVIQDYNSQRVAELFSNLKLPNNPKVWDCCAASGGKTIMAYDNIKGAIITASDVRTTIVHNLNKRLKEAGVQCEKIFVAESSNQNDTDQNLGASKFDFIICDAPCSGSGTWGRTPEQLKFFDPKNIEYYHSLQLNIATNSIRYLKPNGYFLYITCSVFYRENEGIKSILTDKNHLELIEEKYFKGYNDRSDTMYGCLLKKNSV